MAEVLASAADEERAMHGGLLQMSPQHLRELQRIEVAVSPCERHGVQPRDRLVDLRFPVGLMRRSAAAEAYARSRVESLDPLPVGERAELVAGAQERGDSELARTGAQVLR